LGTRTEGGAPTGETIGEPALRNRATVQPVSIEMPLPGTLLDACAPRRVLDAFTAAVELTEPL